jgi:hypothetical protein
MTFPDDQGQPATFEFDEHHFSYSRRNASHLPILLDHDPELEIGRIDSLWPNSNSAWWMCSFTLNEDLIRTPFELGQNVSIAFAWHPNHPSVPNVGEVSIVRHGRIPGAEITLRYESDYKPSPPAATPPPPPAARTAEGERYHGRVLRRNVGKVLAVTDQHGVRTEFQ